MEKLKLIIILVSLCVLVYCQKNSSGQKSITETEGKFVAMPDSSKSFIMLDEDTFNYFLNEDLKNTDLAELEVKYGKFSDKELVDSALNSIYGRPFTYRRLKDEEYMVSKELGRKLLLLLIGKNYPDAYAFYGQAVIDCAIKPCDNKFKAVQYLMKSATLDSAYGLYLVGEYYVRLRKYRQAVEVLHYLADSLQNEDAMLQLYQLYETGMFMEDDEPPFPGKDSVKSVLGKIAHSPKKVKPDSNTIKLFVFLLKIFQCRYPDYPARIDNSHKYGCAARQLEKLF